MGCLPILSATAVDAASLMFNQGPFGGHHLGVSFLRVLLVFFGGGQIKAAPTISEGSPLELDLLFCGFDGPSTRKPLEPIFGSPKKTSPPSFFPRGQPLPSPAGSLDFLAPADLDAEAPRIAAAKGQLLEVAPGVRHARSSELGTDGADGERDASGSRDGCGEGRSGEGGRGRVDKTWVV